MSDIQTLAAAAARDLASGMAGLVASDKSGRFQEIAADFLELQGLYGSAFGADRDRLSRELAALAVTVRLIIRDEKIAACQQGNGDAMLMEILGGAGAVFATLVRAGAAGLAEGAIKGIAGGLG